MSLLVFSLRKTEEPAKQQSCLTLGRSDFLQSRKDTSTSFKRAGTPRDNQPKGASKRWSRYVFVGNFLEVGNVGHRVAEVLEFHLDSAIIFRLHCSLNLSNNSLLVHTATGTMLCTGAKIRNLIFCIQETRYYSKSKIRCEV